MYVFTVTEALINKGKEAFAAGVRQYLGGPNSPFYEDELGRDSGVAVVPGAIVAALESGAAHEEEIIPMVTRVSRCRWSTVATILEALSKETIPDRLWAQAENGRFELVQNGERNSFSVITARSISRNASTQVRESQQNNALMGTDQAGWRWS